MERNKFLDNFLLEEIAKRKQREPDQVNMKAGARVLCSDNHGHTDKLSPGNMYDVLDERAEAHAGVAKLTAVCRHSRYFFPFSSIRRTASPMVTFSGSVPLGSEIFFRPYLM